MAAASAALIAFPELVEATTSTIFAPGAMAWAYCTSKLVSTLQPASSWCVSWGAKTGHPSGHRIVKDGGAGMWNRDRKSTRLNSSHLVISYAVFCLKKKKKHIQRE